MAWATIAQARDHWSDASTLSDPVLTTLLGIATEQCMAYAPVLLVDAPVPDRFMLATVYQAREVYRSQATGGDQSSDVIGLGNGFDILARPLTQSVKALLRPQTRRMVVG